MQLGPKETLLSPFGNDLGPRNLKNSSITTTLLQTNKNLDLETPSDH